MEPLYAGGKLVVSSSEFTALLNTRGGPEAVYLWSGGVAYEVSSLLHDGVIRLPSGLVLNPQQWLEYPSPQLFRVVDSLEEYLEWARPRLEPLRGQRLLVAYSGGKDSRLVLSILSALEDMLGFRLSLVYVHVPYLEPEKLVWEALGYAERLGYTVTVLEPPRRIVEAYLRREGLPYRGYRWCTYLKTRPMRDYAKAIGARILVVGDRVWEAGKRMRRMAGMLLEGRLYRKGVAYPVALLTVHDTIALTRRLGAVHPAYLEGYARVSCSLCPYKSAYELSLGLGELEDPGLIEEVLRMEWRRWYQDRVDYETFVEEHLWRYQPQAARVFAEAKKLVEKVHKEKGLPVLTLEEARRMHTWEWMASTKELEERLPKLGIEEALRRLRMTATQHHAVQLEHSSADNTEGTHVRTFHLS